MQYYRSTKFIHALLFFSIAFTLPFPNPLNKLAKLTCRIDPPDKPAKLTCRINPPKWPALWSRGKKSWFSPAQMRTHSSLPNRLARVTPLPRSEFPGRTRPANTPLPPPPSQLCVREERGEGVGASQALQSILNRHFYFHSLYKVNYACSIWHNIFRILYRVDQWIWKYNYIAYRRRNCYKEGVRGGPPLASVEGLFAITDRKSAG